MGIIVLENPEYCKVGLNNRQEGRQRSDCRESFFYTGCIHKHSLYSTFLSFFLAHLPLIFEGENCKTKST